MSVVARVGGERGDGIRSGAVLLQGFELQYVFCVCNSSTPFQRKVLPCKVSTFCPGRISMNPLPSLRSITLVLTINSSANIGLQRMSFLVRSRSSLAWPKSLAIR